MPDASALRAALIAQFRAAFGEPNKEVDGDVHWSLRPFSYVAAINILVNGSSRHPVVWCFDPHDPKNGVHHEIVKDEAQIERIIAAVVERVKHAGRPEK
jgi:hypothetical protein